MLAKEHTVLKVVHFCLDFRLNFILLLEFFGLPFKTSYATFQNKLKIKLKVKLEVSFPDV